MSRTRIGAIVLAAVVSSFGIGAGVAQAHGRVVIEAPAFMPEAEFPAENGYYRTNEGNYYHYDRDRQGWHHGRNHAEGIRFERHEGRRR